MSDGMSDDLTNDSAGDANALNPTDSSAHNGAPYTDPATNSASEFDAPDAPTQPLIMPLPGAEPLPPQLARYAGYSAGTQRQQQAGFRAGRILWIALGAALLLAVVCAGVSLASFSAVLGGFGGPGGLNGSNGGAPGGSSTTVVSATNTPTSDIVIVTATSSPPDATPTPTLPPSPTATSTPIPQPVLTVTKLSLSGSCFRAYFHVHVSNTGGGTLHWFVASSFVGITVYPTSGYLPAGSTPQTVRISGHAPLGATVHIHFTSNGGNLTVTLHCS